MQIGIDLGATKIEYVLLDNNNIELKRDRVQTPKDYENTIISITEIVKKLENKSGKFNVGICHPGAVDKTTGLIKNAHNSQWLNNKNLIKDLKLKINNNFLSENDANCFCLSEAFDGSASHYETVFITTYGLFFHIYNDPSLVHYSLGFFELLFQSPLPYMVESDCFLKLWSIFSNRDFGKPILTGS